MRYLKSSRFFFHLFVIFAQSRRRKSAIPLMFPSTENFTIIVTVGELAPKIITGLLLEHAASSINGVNSSHCTATFVRPTPLLEAPLLVSPGGIVEKFELELLRRIEFVYLPNRRDFVTYFANLQPKNDVADCLVVDKMETYCCSSSTAIYSLFAFLEQNFQWLFTKSKHFCPMVVSMNVENVDEALEIGRNLRTFTMNSLLLVDDEASLESAVLLEGDRRSFRFTLTSDLKTITVSKL